MTFSRFLLTLLTRCGLIGLLAWGLSAQASDLSQRLASADHVLLMRHAYAPGVGDPAGYVLGRCESQRLLNDEGKAQATRTGHWLRQQGVQQADVHSSPWCRCLQTAERLGLGTPRQAEALASFFDQPEQAGARTAALQQLVAERLARKGNQALILVTHDVNIRAFSGASVRSGEMVLARVNAQGQSLDYQVLPLP